MQAAESWADVPMGALQLSAAPAPTASHGAAAHDDPFGLHLEGSSAQSIAAQGVASGGGALPHGEAIQKAFGRHDVSGISAHVGGDAAQSTAALGAEAYATGDRVAFASAPSLHLAAHEAAHVVQQRAGVSLKGGVGQAGDVYERHADAVADAVAAGTSAEAMLDHGPGGGGGASGVVQRQEAGAPAPAATAPGASFVTFDTNGNWVASDVLGKLGPTSVELSEAITAGAKATATMCVSLRDRVNAAAAKDSSRKAACDEIARALTSRITELAYATPQSPLTYDQLRKVGEWSDTFPAAESTAAPPKPAEATAAADPVEAHALAMANKEGYRVPGDHDVVRNKVDPKEPKKGVQFTQANDVEENNPQFPGYRFVRDPFDNTVVAVRPDGTGTQFVFKVEQKDTGPTLTLDKKVELSQLRVKELARLDKAGLSEKQETEAQKNARIQTDKDNGNAAREEWAKNPANAKLKAEYEAAMAQWAIDKKAAEKEGKKAPPMPPRPKDMPTDKMTTNCTNWPAPVYHAGGGSTKTNFSFTPPTEHPGWRDAKTNPAGPKPGDLYWLYDLVNKRTAHMGVVKSRVSAGATAEGDPLETWTVTDGGQGGYANIQEVQERSRGPYNPKTQIFSSSIAEAGQSKGDRQLTGWIDVDKEHEAETVST